MKRNVLLIITLISISLSISKSLKAQERIGLSTGNWSGVYGTMLNPSSFVSNPDKWNISLVAGGAFAENNFAYIANSNLPGLIKNSNNIALADTAAEGQQTDALLLNFYNNNKGISAYVNTIITGPSVLFHIRNHSIGIFINARAISSANKIPSIFRPDNFNNIAIDSSFLAEPFEISGMAWAEFGLNYGNSIISTRDKQLDWGVSVKFIRAYEAYFVKNHETALINKETDSLLAFSGINMSYGYAGAAFADNSEQAPVKSGAGLSTDFGINYTIGKGVKPGEYDWKLGFSIIDFGKVWLRDNSQQHRLNVENLFDLSAADIEDIESIDDLSAVLEQEVLNGESSTLEDDRFSLWAPGAVSFQADFGSLNPFYLNFIIVRRIPTLAPGLDRGNIFGVSPRIEFKWFGITMPLVLYNDTDFRMGLSLKLGPITLGSDNLLSLVKDQNELSGSDAYVSLNISPFLNKRGGKSRNGRMNGGIDCYSF